MPSRSHNDANVNERDCGEVQLASACVVKPQNNGAVANGKCSASGVGGGAPGRGGG